MLHCTVVKLLARSWSAGLDSTSSSSASLVLSGCAVAASLLDMVRDSVEERRGFDASVDKYPHWRSSCKNWVSSVHLEVLSRRWNLDEALCLARHALRLFGRWQCQRMRTLRDCYGVARHGVRSNNEGRKDAAKAKIDKQSQRCP